MKKCMITITAVSQEETFPTVVLDISPVGVFVSYPKGSGIKIESMRGHARFELFIRLPRTDEEVRFHFNNLHISDKSSEIEFGATFRNPRETYLVRTGHMALEH